MEEQITQNEITTEDKHPGGRPTDYGDWVIKETLKYIDTCKDEEREIMNADKLTTRVVVNLPSIEGLAIYLGVARKTLYNWSSKHEEFLHILELLLAEQAKRLINNGLSGDYNATIVKLVLSKHDYHDSNKTDLTSNGDKITGFNYIIPNGNNTDIKTEPETTPGV